MKRVVAILMGVMALLSLPLSSYADALDYPYFGPQTMTSEIQDPYLYFGDSTYARGSAQGIDLVLDYTSISHQGIIGTMTMPSSMIGERGIQEFIVLANGRLVDQFAPQWNQAANTWQSYYPLRIYMQDFNIGGLMSLQVVALTRENVTQDYTEKYVVAWSAPSDLFKLDPLPTQDDEAIGVLESILAKLEELKNSLEGKLEQLNNSIKKIYEIPPATQTNFDAALDNLMSKLPTEQIKNDAQEMQNLISNSASRIENAPQKVKFGEINWMGVVTTPAIDFTGFMDQITMIRRMLQIFLWCEFFYFVIKVLRPTLTV